MVPPSSDRISRVPPYSSSPSYIILRVRGFHPLSPDFPDRSPVSYTTSDSGLLPFRSPLLGESRLISFPRGTWMFRFPRFAPSHYFIHLTVMQLPAPGFPIRTSPAVNASSRLTGAFRRNARPSSPLTARASTVYAYSLNLATRKCLGSPHALLLACLLLPVPDC